MHQMHVARGDPSETGSGERGGKLAAEPPCLVLLCGHASFALALFYFVLLIPCMSREKRDLRRVQCCYVVLPLLCSTLFCNVP